MKKQQTLVAHLPPPKNKKTQLLFNLFEGNQTPQLWSNQLFNTGLICIYIYNMLFSCIPCRNETWFAGKFMNIHPLVRCFSHSYNHSKKECPSQSYLMTLEAIRKYSRKTSQKISSLAQHFCCLNPKNTPSIHVTNLKKGYPHYVSRIHMNIP